MNSDVKEALAEMTALHADVVETLKLLARDVGLLSRTVSVLGRALADNGATGEKSLSDIIRTIVRSEEEAQRLALVLPDWREGR